MYTLQLTEEQRELLLKLVRIEAILAIDKEDVLEELDDLLS